MEPRIVRLPRSGPLPGRSVRAWVERVDVQSRKALERGRWPRRGAPEGRASGAKAVGLSERSEGGPGPERSEGGGGASRAVGEGKAVGLSERSERGGGRIEGELTSYPEKNK